MIQKIRNLDPVYYVLYCIFIVFLKYVYFVFVNPDICAVDFGFRCADQISVCSRCISRIL